ncbi:hypothetical protein IG631_09890 [Alternaria alternata]|nr:hypothetical protein IG631_09890 [Alternaria alternata]
MGVPPPAMWKDGACFEFKLQSKALAVKPSRWGRRCIYTPMHPHGYRSPASGFSSVPRLLSRAFPTAHTNYFHFAIQLAHDWLKIGTLQD